MESGERYVDGAYLEHNPDWHAAESPWKAEQVLRMLGAAPLNSVCEVGCGVGEILQALHRQRPELEMVGYEISPQAFEVAKRGESDRVSFVLGDAAEDPASFDVMLVMDVIEHVPDPVAFLAGLRHKAPRAILHIPLDISVQSVLRPQRLISARNSVGHIHYFTPETAVATVEDAGYTVDATQFTSGYDIPAGLQSGWAKAARWPRKALPDPLASRILGGYSLLVSASVRD